MELFGWQITYIPSFGGALLAIGIIFLLAMFGVNTKNNLGLLLGKLYESMYEFFEDIMGSQELPRVKSFITNMFFVILLYNLLGLIFDNIGPIFGYNQDAESFYLAELIHFGTSDYHFTIAMAIVGVILMLAIQLMSQSGTLSLGGKNPVRHSFLKVANLVYEYLPFRGKGIITMDKGTMNPVVYYPLRIVVKAFDILISLFVGFLDIVGLAAKVISLAFRLFGNMLSGTALFTVMIVGLSASTMSRFGVELPLIAPLILVIQGLLVASIQAFVFPLLVGIFIKVARMGSEEAEATS